MNWKIGDEFHLYGNTSITYLITEIKEQTENKISFTFQVKSIRASYDHSLIGIRFHRLYFKDGMKRPEEFKAKPKNTPHRLTTIFQ